MINKQDAIQILKRFTTEILPNELWFQLIQPSIKAMVLYGSVAKGTNRPDSDIDMLIILPLEHEKKYTVGEYEFEFEGHEINIVLRSIERLRFIAKEQSDQFQKEVFRDSEILYCSDKEVESLLEGISRI